MIVRGRVIGSFAENSYVVGCPESGEGVLVDPGGDVPELLDIARTAGLDIGAIWLTHAHIDHVAGVADAASRTGAPVLLHRDDLFLYEAVEEQARMFGLTMEALPAPGGWLEAGESLSLGGESVEVIHVPGHSPGHVAFWMPSDRLVLAGDCLFSGSIGRTDLPGGSMPTLLASISDRLFPLGDDVRVLPGHGPETTVGRERTANPFFIDGGPGLWPHEDR